MATAGGKHNQQSIDYARVTHVSPITKTIETSTPVENCWNEEVAYQQPRHSKRNSNSGYIHKNEALGAVLGAAIANHASRKSKNRNTVTAVGAVIGTMIGSDIKRKSERAHSYEPTYTEYRTVKRCNTEQKVTYTEKVVAYRVSYKYRGQTYSARMNNHPGDRIKVRVSVNPVIH